MASLQKRGDYWYVVFNNYRGKQRWVKGYTDKRESQALANRLEDEKTKLKRGDIDPRHEQRKIDRAKPVEDHIKEYRAALQAKGNLPNHVAYVVSDIRAFFSASGVTHAAAATRPMMDQWVLVRMNAGVDSRSTINRRVGSVKAFLKHLHAVGTLTDYVLYKFPKLATAGHERRKRRALEVDEQAKLLATTSDPERRELYRFCLGTGARHSACVDLKVRDVHFDERTIELRAKDKGHQKPKYTIPLHHKLLPMLTRRCENKGRDDSVLVVPPTRDAAKLVRADCESAGIDTDSIDFHALRHTFITTLAKATIHPNVVQALAGHADIKTTLNFYTHFKRSDERDALNIIDL